MTQPLALANMRLRDNVILVTGSTTGIGEGMARLFAREGAGVMIHGRRKDSAQRLAAEIGERASFVIGALEDPQIPLRLIAETIARFGKIDGLVNNAALMTRGGLESTDVEAFRSDCRGRLEGAVSFDSGCAPSLSKTGRGPRAEHRLRQRLLRRAERGGLFHLQGRPDDPDA